MDAIKKIDVIKQAELSTAKRLGIKEGLLKGRQEGRQEGLLEGRQEYRMELISTMIRAGYSYEQINELSPLSWEEYHSLGGDL